MNPVILVHGAFQGAYVWSRILNPMRALGLQPFAPDLKGLGSRRHELTPLLGLKDHVDQICDQINALDSEEPVILFGHSYASLVITGVAKRIPERLKGLVYLDSPIPTHPNGHPQSLLDILGPDVTNFFMSQTEDGIVSTFPAAGFGLSETEHAEIVSQHSGQSLKCFTDTVATWHPDETPDFPIAYIFCKPGNQFTREQAQKAKQRNLLVYEIEAGHCPMVTCPQEFVNLVVNEVVPAINNHSECEQKFSLA